MPLEIQSSKKIVLRVQRNIKLETSNSTWGGSDACSCGSTGDGGREIGWLVAMFHYNL